MNAKELKISWHITLMQLNSESEYSTTWERPDDIISGHFDPV